MLSGMSEGIDLPRVARGTLLSEAERAARLDLASPQILAAVAGEGDPIVVQSTLVALLWETLAQASWVGFYRRVAEAQLSVGPYQGPMGCLHIDFSRGVCGACARTRAPQLVPDVRAFPDHIACDDATLSELVLPVLGGRAGDVQAVLDLDSRSLAAFSLAEQRALESLLARAFAGVAWPPFAQGPR
jgi:GAF domain-containing protein